MASKTFAVKRKFNNYLLELVLLLLIVVLAFSAPSFLTIGNILNVFRNISMQGIVALGMTMVIIAGDIDLSVGSGVAFYGCLTAVLTNVFKGAQMLETPAALLAMLITLILSGFIGVLMALSVNKFKVSAFITTLAFMAILRGSALLVTNGFPTLGFPSWYKNLGGGMVLSIPVPAILFTCILLLVMFIMTQTPFGKSIYAVGSNAESARLSGINVQKVRIIIFAATSMMTALSGLLISSQINAGTPTVANGWEMNVISSVIIGGTSLSGGSGTIRGTLIGCIFLGVLMNGMTLLNINEYWQYVVRGSLIFVAVFMNNLKNK